MSIYKFTKQKLITHGVNNSVNGRIILIDKRLFILFVKLERGRRASDLRLIQDNINEIASYTRNIGKPYLLIFAFMYVRFSDFTPHNIQYDVRLDNGEVRYVNDYKRPVTQVERAIGEWALAMYHQHERHFMRAIYPNTEEEH